MLELTMTVKIDNSVNVVALILSVSMHRNAEYYEENIFVSGNNFAVSCLS